MKILKTIKENDQFATVSAVADLTLSIIVMKLQSLVEMCFHKEKTHMSRILNLLKCREYE